MDASVVVMFLLIATICNGNERSSLTISLYLKWFYVRVIQKIINYVTTNKKTNQ